jgi:signal transduction histidine kinase
MAAAFDQVVDALDAAIGHAGRAETAMRDSLADASHELRTPIAALQATAETLPREQPSRRERDALEASLAQDAAHLGRLAGDLLVARSQIWPAASCWRSVTAARSRLASPHSVVSLFH